MKPGAHRDRLTHLCYIGTGDPIAIMERAFIALQEVKPLDAKLTQAVKVDIPRKATLAEKLVLAKEQGLLTDEVEQMENADELRRIAISVDDFNPERFSSLTLAG